VVRTTLGAEVETTVSVSGSEGVAREFLDQSTSLADNTTEIVSVAPPSGVVYELLALKVSVRGVSGATGNDHRVEVAHEATGQTVLTMTSNPTDRIDYRDNIVNTATRTQRPSTEIAQLMTVRGLRADSTRGFRIAYRNRTGLSQTQTRQYRFVFREIQVEEI
jgi:hypothetical protein